MKILHLSAQKPDSTGSGTYLAQLVAGFNRAGHSQAVIAGIGPDDAPVFPEGVAFFPVRFETDELPFPVAGMSNVMPYKATRYPDFTPEMTEQFKAAFARVVGQALGEFKPDLVLCNHLYLATAVAVNTLRARQTEDPALAQTRIMAISHSTDLNQTRQIPLERAFIADAMRRLDAALALHGAQAAEIADVYGVDPARIHVIGTGYDAQLFQPLPGLREEGARRLVYVGKIWRRKGVESLVRAIDGMPADLAPTEALLIGGYSSREEYERIAAQVAACRYPMRIVDALPQPELVKHYSRSNVFVLPSFFEGLPLVMVEAMACGCNVVVTDLPGIQEWVARELPDAPVRYVAPPRMVDDDNPQPEDLPVFEAALAQALSQALSDPEPTCDSTVLSWDAVCTRVLNVL